MIGYTCKYTPVELLSAFGGEPVLLNREAADFTRAEELTHNHFCCHAKAVLEECGREGVRELVLVNCCDSIRRCYDVLRDRGELDFLFLLDLPHHDDGCARARLAAELKRLAAEYGAYRGAKFDAAAFRAAFTPRSPLPTGPFLAVTGARAGESLLAALRRASPIPVEDFTCGGNRFVPPPEGLGEEPDGLLDWYAGALLGQIPCLRMDAVGRREELLAHPNLKGLVYHTVKFCDYYAFEYENLRKTTALPLLKVETDFTPLSAGQLSTRLEAFLEGMNLRAAPASAGRRGKYVAGIDSGSTTTNVVVLDLDGNVAASAIVRTGPKASQGAEKAFAALDGLSPADMAAIVATGYGRSNIPFATGQVTEITCHARGAHRLYPQARAIVDIGGQDSKVICLDGEGNVTNFVMNDKCAAGTRALPGADGPHPGAGDGRDGGHRPVLGAGADHLQHVHRLCRVGGGLPHRRQPLRRRHRPRPEPVGGGQDRRPGQPGGGQRALHDDRRRGPQPGGGEGPGGAAGRPPVDRPRPGSLRRPGCRPLRPG